MKLSLIFFLSFALAAFALDSTTRKAYESAHSCVQRRTCGSHDFIQRQRAEPNTQINLIFAVTLKNTELLEKTLYSVSDPRSPIYGQHLSKTEVEQMTTDVAAMTKVENYLRAFPSVNVDSVHSSGFLKVSGPVRAFENMLHAKFHHYVSAISGMRVVRTDSYSLPAHVGQFVDTVLGTTQLFPTYSLRKNYHYQPNQDADGAVTPSVINTVYNVDTNEVNNENATQAVYENLGQNFSPSDLQAFQEQFSLPEIEVTNVIGPNDPSVCECNNCDTCMEANLDVQYMIAVANANTTFWSIPDSVPDPFVSWIMAVGDSFQPPLVHSISYNSIEDEMPHDDMTRFNQEAQKLGIRGITILSSSGDDGVANFPARNNPLKCGFSPAFPSTSPFITAVGATQGPESGKPEVACVSKTGGITTGGGFSDFFDRPSYQDQAVQQYLQDGPNMPPTSQFNSAGRGYPDVALLGYNYESVDNNKIAHVSGTSASTPVFAGMITLINDARMQQGRGSLGFINPALYQISSSIYNDVTSGENNCAAQGEFGHTVCCKYGFTATTGWDPLTGFGSVNFGSLRSALSQM